MNELSFAREASTWLEPGPTQLPPDAIDRLAEAIADVPQDRPVLGGRLAGLGSSRIRLMTTAAAIVLAVGLTGFALVRVVHIDIATPPDTRDLLRGEPDAERFMERSGGPDTSDQRVEVGKLPYKRAFVIVASCTGEGAVIVGAYYPPDAQAYPSGGPPPTEPMPVQTFVAPCDGAPHRLEVSTVGTIEDRELDVLVDVPAGITWSVAIGEYPGLGAAPVFPPVEATTGFLIVTDDRPTLITQGFNASYGIPNGAGQTEMGVFVRCSGSPITVSASEGGDGTVIACDDSTAITRVAFPVEGFPTAWVRSEGPSWVAVTIEVDPPAGATLPAAPAMPSELAAVGFAESDGLNIGFGSLGSNVQTLVPAKDAFVGRVSGDSAVIAVRDPDGTTRIEHWSISKAAPTALLATLAAGDNFGPSWIDLSHGQAFYSVFKADFTSEWHRVGLDGSDDTVIAASPPDGPDAWVLSDAVLAVDESVFVIDGCAIGKPCARVIYDTATRSTRQVELVGDATCRLVGAIDGLVVARSAPTCTGSERQVFTVQDLDGGERRVLVTEELVDMGETLGVVIPGSSGPQFVYTLIGETETTYRAVGLDGGEPRDIGTFSFPVMSLTPSLVPLPLPDWVLLARELVDSPLFNGARPAPRLVNVTTGETIELVNLPHPDG